jgi:hypothetical protein
VVLDADWTVLSREPVKILSYPFPRSCSQSPPRVHTFVCDARLQLSVLEDNDNTIIDDTFSNANEDIPEKSFPG